MSPLPILVIGAGVSGSACAIRLRRHGIQVVLAEQAVFPRTKVCGCCLGGAGLQTLEQLSLRSWVQQVGERTQSWQASIGGKLVELELPEGVAISRQALDTKLLETADQAGAEVHSACTAKIVNVQNRAVVASLQEDGKVTEHEFSAVVVAAGLRASSVQQMLPWYESPHGPFGVSFTADPESRIEAGVIYMACDEDGYVGLVQLEDGRIDIAAALASGGEAAGAGTPIQRVEAILERSSFPDWEFRQRSVVMTTPPLRRTRKAGSGRVLAIGDAAGYVEPFTGEGMTWGMQSGIAAADLLATVPADQAGEAWETRVAGLLRTPKRNCRIVTTALRYRIARQAAAQMLSRFPGVATPLIRSLNAG